MQKFGFNVLCWNVDIYSVHTMDKNHLGSSGGYKDELKSGMENAAQLTLLWGNKQDSKSLRTEQGAGTVV